MPIAGSETQVRVAATDVAGTEVDGIKSATFSPAMDLADTTAFNDTTKAKAKFATLSDGTISLSGDYEGADTNGQNLLRSSHLTRAPVWCRILWDGTTGHKVQCYVESFEISSEVSAVVQFSCSLSFTAEAGTV